MSNHDASSISLPRIKLKLPSTAPLTADHMERRRRDDDSIKLNSDDVKKGYKKKTSAVSSQGTSGGKKGMASVLDESSTPSPALTSDVDPLGTATATGNHESVVMSAGSKTGKRRLPSNIADDDGSFGDYASALRTAVVYQRSKNWSLRKAQLRTGTGYTLDVMTWCTKHASRHTTIANATGIQQPLSKHHSLHITMDDHVKSVKSSRSAAIPASQVIKLARQGSNTFVCTHQGCHRIFDDQTRWRRHQNGHIRHVK